MAPTPLTPPATARPAAVIDTPEGLIQGVAHWRAQPAVAVDTESNSYYAYRERTCLVQISTRAADWIVDPLALDPRPLEALFVDPAVEKVFHAGDNDVAAFQRDFGFGVANVFDTAIAAKAVGRKKVGLQSLLAEVLQVALIKDEQLSDWGRRPLTADQISYAFADTRYLLALADALKAEVSARGPDIVEEVSVDCRGVALQESRVREVDPEAFERHPLARRMDPVARQVLRALFDARERRGRELDCAVFRIVSDKALGEIALHRPASSAELQRIRGVTPAVLARHGDLLLATVREAVAAGPLPYARKPAAAAVDAPERERYEALRVWRRRTAEARGVEVEVIASNATPKAVARAAPASLPELAASGALDSYQPRRYGEEIVGLLRAAAA